MEAMFPNETRDVLADLRAGSNNSLTLYQAALDRPIASVRAKQHVNKQNDR